MSTKIPVWREKRLKEKIVEMRGIFIHVDEKIKPIPGSLSSY